MIEHGIRDAAAWLDFEKPGWEQLVDTHTLNMVFNCILDQAFREEAQRDRGDLRGFLWSVDRYDSQWLGRISQGGFAMGKGYWIQEIAARRAAPTAP